MAYPFRAILSPIQFDDPLLLGLGFAKRIAQDSGANPRRAGSATTPTGSA